MIAPEPFFEPRGTPFSEFHRIRALVELGHTVDLVTYPFGKDVSIPGLRVFRSLRPPFVREVRIGPSLAKIPLDALLTLTVIRRALGEPVRRGPLARGRQFHRRGPGGRARRAASVRHALEPAPAAHELRVQPIAGAPADLRSARAVRHPPFARRDRDLSAPRGDGQEHRPRGADRPDRELSRVRRHAGRGIGASGSGRSSGLSDDHTDGAVHRNVRGVSGARSAVRCGRVRDASAGRTSGSFWRVAGRIRSTRHARRRAPPALATR